MTGTTAAARFSKSMSGAIARRTRSVQCISVRMVVDAVASGERLISPRLQVHVDRCLNCQAEMIRSRVVRRELVSMRSVVHEAPSGVLAGKFDAVRLPAADANTPSAQRWLPAAASAMAIGVAIVASRRLRSSVA